jgi:hypothetical protein
VTYRLTPGVVDVVPAGMAVSIDRAFQPGDVAINVNEGPCDGTAPVVLGVEADVVLEVQGNRCSLALRYTHEFGAIHHPITGGVFGAIAANGAIVTLRSLEPGSPMPPIEVMSGPDGVGAMEVPLGRYEVTATIDGEVVRSRQIALVPGGDIVVDLMGLQKRIPRSCGQLGTATCEIVIQAAMSYDQWVHPSDIVTAVTVKKTKVEPCDPSIEPELDVVFQAPDGAISATVGRTADGQWRVCPAY